MTRLVSSCLLTIIIYDRSIALGVHSLFIFNPAVLLAGYVPFAPIPLYGTTFSTDANLLRNREATNRDRESTFEFSIGYPTILMR